MSDYFGSADVLRQLETELGQEIIWNNRTLKCIAGSRSDTRELGPGGFAPDATVEIVVRKALFTVAGVTTYPAPQDAVTFDGQSLSINQVQHSHDSDFIVLSCDHADKDA